MEKSAKFEVIIIGGGPGGMSAALWCTDLGLNVAIFEKEAEFGGQMLSTHNPIGNYLGVETANGREMRDRFLRQIERAKIQRFERAEIVRADLSKRTIILADGRAFYSDSIVIATGTGRRKLCVAGEEGFRGRGILESGVKSKNDMTGKTVLIVGGGDAALENALILGEVAEKVIVVHRRSKFTARTDFVDRASGRRNVEFLLNTSVTAIIGNAVVEGVELLNTETGVISTVESDHVLIRIGVEPNIELFRGQIAMEETGYIVVNPQCETDLKGIFAIGDVANPLSHSVSSAAGMGATAAKIIFQKLKN